MALRSTGVSALMLIAVLAGCGGRQADKGNAVTMRDVEVVDGTANDAMTDLDAAQVDGTGLAFNGSGGAAANQAAAPRAKDDASDDSVPANAQAVPSE
jgi:hypothetical protein